MAKKKRTWGGPKDQVVLEGAPSKYNQWAWMLGQLVCGIWLILFLSLAASDENRPEWWWVGILAVVGGFIAFAVPYVLVRLFGLIMTTRGKRRGKD